MRDADRTLEQFKDYNIDGQITVKYDIYELEYEPRGQTGDGTIYLRVKDQKHCVPIHINKLDAIIELLDRVRSAIVELEG